MERAPEQGGYSTPLYHRRAILVPRLTSAVERIASILAEGRAPAHAGAIAHPVDSTIVAGEPAQFRASVASPASDRLQPGVRARPDPLPDRRVDPPPNRNAA